MAAHTHARGLLLQSGTVEAAEVAIASSINRGLGGVEARNTAPCSGVSRVRCRPRMSPTRDNLLLEICDVTEKQRTDLLERLLRLLLHNAIDQAGLQSATYAPLVVKVRKDTQPLQVDYVNPQGLGLVTRGDKTEDLFEDLVDFTSERRTAYDMRVETPSANAGSGSAQHLASVARDSMPQVRQTFSQTKAHHFWGRTRPWAGCGWDSTIVDALLKRSSHMERKIHCCRRRKRA